jgi:hypothetical protein
MAEAKKGNSKVFLWIALGCGGLLFLGLATGIGVYFYFSHIKGKITSEIAKDNPALAEAIQKGGITGGIKGGAGQMVAAGISMYGSMVLVTTLPKEEQKEHMAVLERLVKVGPQFSTEDIEALSKAMEGVQKAHEADKSLPTADEARTFFEEIKPIAEKYEP